MEVRDEDYLKLNVRPAPDVIARALEQKARFVNGGSLLPGGGAKHSH